MHPWKPPPQRGRASKDYANIRTGHGNDRAIGPESWNQRYQQNKRYAYSADFDKVAAALQVARSQQRRDELPYTASNDN